MDQEKRRAQEQENQEKRYDYRQYPENVCQMGEVTGQRRIYIEDYVLTHIRRVFCEQQDQSIVVFVGKMGCEEAKEAVFIYGALEIPLQIETEKLTQQRWDEIYRELHQYFPGGNILGWGLGVGMWNSKIDQRVRQFQEEQFPMEGGILFLSDLSEREEKLFLYDENAFEELTGYFVYYERNPQMQEYMLREQDMDSFEAAYEDEVTKTIRTVIHKKKTRQEKMQYVVYGAGVILFLMVLFGANLLVQSLAKINSMEKTIEALSGYVTEEEKDADVVISHALETTARPSASPSSSAPTSQPASASTAAAVRSTVSAAATATPSPPSPSARATAGPKKSSSPKSTTASPAATHSKATLSGASSRVTQSYIVQKGDTLSQIVWRQYHSFRYLKKVQTVNRIKDSDQIYEGQCILLPNP